MNIKYGDIIKEHTYSNRHSNKILVNRISLTEFIMSGYSDVFYRTSVTEDGKLVMFDPPGGPYTTAKYQDWPGTNMGIYDEEWEGLIVESMEFTEEGVKLTCFYETKVEWIDLKSK